MMLECVFCLGHEMKECTGEAKEKEGEFDEMANSTGALQQDFIFFRVSVLREVCVWNEFHSNFTLTCTSTCMYTAA